MAFQPQEKSVWASMNDSGFFPFNLMIDHSHNFAPKCGLCFPVSYTVRLHKCLPDVERASNLHRWSKGEYNGSLWACCSCAWELQFATRR